SRWYIQRSFTYVMTRESGMEGFLKGFYNEGRPPVVDADLMFQDITFLLHPDSHKDIQRLDKATLRDLAATGFKLEEGADRAGFCIKYLEPGGIALGYYLDLGALNLVAAGKFKVKQGHEIQRILLNGIEFANGHVFEAGEIALMTGCQKMHSTSRKVLGGEIAQSLEPVWDFDQEGEVRGMWRRCSRDGSWFMGGDLSFTRYHSRLLALQIKALEEGLM
ncbi:unnamed protein product, partial [Tuber aestivum]